MEERSAIGLKLLDSSMGFPGLCRGITRPTFQMFGIFALFTERFMVSVRNLSAVVPRWCKWIGAILSGPSALILFVSLIAYFTALHLNILPSISSSLFSLFLEYFFCFSFFLGCGLYCWLKLLAHLLGSW